jgi:hypothetical protein
MNFGRQFGIVVRRHSLHVVKVPTLIEISLRNVEAVASDSFHFSGGSELVE